MWQAIEARLVDESLINLVPVLLGERKRVFDHLGTERIELEGTRVVEAPEGVTHPGCRRISVERVGGRMT